MIAELADGSKLKFPDDTPDETVDAMVNMHIQIQRNNAILESLIKRIEDLTVAMSAPRKITVERDFAGEKVTGATSTVVKRN